MTDFDNYQPVMDFESLSNIFVRLNTYSSPSELHGLTCGVLCAGNYPNDADWLSIVCAHLQLEHIPEDLIDPLQSFFHDICTQLTSSGFSFQPLLPGDDYHLEHRLEAIADWCSGFLNGFGLVFTRQNEQELNDEAKAILRDFTDISRVDMGDALDESKENDNEKSYVEVYEYIRVTTLTLFSEYGCLKNEASEHVGHDQSIH